jgi:antitoxin component YwqK of YwqJK toxin-antitoxin module
MDGIFVEYYDNGVIKTKGKYNKGLKDGTWKYYLPNGVFDRKEKYKDGVIKSDGLLNQLMDVIF